MKPSSLLSSISGTSTSDTVKQLMCRTVILGKLIAVSRYQNSSWIQIISGRWIEKSAMRYVRKFTI
ncbi:unnamed protein product [Tuwongella immobilis]|uniref:Uncharacterized protein n=1 Tax=Tuwongella immobilis TaxID=692036 RepID=A0A6C2YVB7_9BACT|nr:unnamed protein product [Tuwongella immobilis]VTS08732.1 unnamed protein product [Tuwongella immobilis]